MSELTNILQNNFPLIVADLANNHCGDIDLAIQMIEELADLQQKHNLTIVPKFQYRNLDTYIHRDFKGNRTNKYISRFENTRLEFNEFLELTKKARSLGLLTAATPFDEYSSNKVLEHGHNFLKVASVSSNDWKLLESCVSQKLPLIVSLGGLSEYQVERVVSFLKHRRADFALMHCVALYPTQNDALNLGRIRTLSERFQVPVGFSTHENPSNYLAGSLALAAGAQILERHYAKEKKDVSINSYSSKKDLFENWLVNLHECISQLHDKNYFENLDLQKETLHHLQRGLFASRDIIGGEILDETNTYPAFPALTNHYTSSEMTIRTNLVAQVNIAKDAPILKELILYEDKFKYTEKILSKTRELISSAGLKLGSDIDVEISHHIGIEKFEDVGAILIPVINREYAKKIVVMIRNQFHPEHFHKLKEETFLVLKGQLQVNLNDVVKCLLPGDVLVIPRLSKHSMLAIEDTVFEEISSTNYVDDSFYSENLNFIENRKTLISLWF
jgi:N-acetylneuraminate synthase